MEDKKTKQEIAQSELSEVLGPGILALEPESTPSNYVELPKPDGTQEPQGNTTVNNLNVNVNLNGNQTKNENVIKTETTNTIKNALPTVATSNEELKKNSSEPLRISSEGNSNKSSSDIIEEAQNNMVQSPTIVDFPNNSEIATLDMKGLDVFDQGNLAEYTYSTSKFKNTNVKVQQAYQILHNVVEHSITNQEILDISPYSTIDAAYPITSSNTTYNVENLQVEYNKNNNLSEVAEMAKQTEMQSQSNRAEKTRNTNQLTGKNKEEMIDEDIQDATVVGSTSGITPIKNDKPKRQMTHLNPTPSMIPMFIGKMNSPPIWRTVLG